MDTGIVTRDVWYNDIVVSDPFPSSSDYQLLPRFSGSVTNLLLLLFFLAGRGGGKEGVSAAL